ncbi:MAG: hypothetical protein ABIN95_06640 [Mucilaginibacter sp.]
MDTRLQYLQTATQLKTQAVQALYNKYAGLLLGYIVGVVNDEKQAEQYLVDTFKEVALRLEEFSKQESNEYCKLQLVARKQLSGYFETTKDCAPLNKHTTQMTLLQQQVFCGVHYHGKKTALLAAELNMTEDTVRKTLKEAFSIIRKNNGDA